MRNCSITKKQEQIWAGEEGEGELWNDLYLPKGECGFYDMYAFYTKAVFTEEMTPEVQYCSSRLLLDTGLVI